MPLLLYAGGVWGQRVDSSLIQLLEDSLQHETDSRKRVDLLNTLAWESLRVDIARSVQYVWQADSLAQAIGYIRGMAAARKVKGRIGVLKGDYLESLKDFYFAIDYYENNKQDARDSLELASLYRYIGILQHDHGNREAARDYFFRSMEISRALGDRRGEATVLNNLGTLYLKKEDVDSAIYYLNQARLLNLEIKNEEHLSANYTNLGFASAIKGDQKEAIEYYTKSLELSKKYDDKMGVATALNNIGDGYMNLGQLQKADSFLRESMKISEKEGFKYLQYVNYYTMGEINEKKEDYKESVKWYKKAEETHQEVYKSGTLSALMEIQKQQLDLAKKREINKINALNAQKFQAERFKKLLYLSVAISSLLLLLGITYYYMRRHKASLKIEMQSREILKQKEQIEQQSEQIKQVNKTLRERNKRLRELNEEKIYMMSVVAHDLKSPLNQIAGLVNVIKLDEDKLTDTQKECLDNISVVSGRLNELINKILGSRNKDTRQEDIEIESLNINQVAENVVNDFREIAGNKKIDLNLNAPKEDVRVKADRHYLRQVLDNLVSNAIKFSPANTRVDINIFRENGTVQLEVVDEGPGLTEEDLEKLFTEYAVLSAKPTGGESSTGLGLAIVKNYVEKLGGQIWCESEAGKGAAFKVRFPAA